MKLVKVAIDVRLGARRLSDLRPSASMPHSIMYLFPTLTNRLQLLRHPLILHFDPWTLKMYSESASQP